MNPFSQKQAGLTGFPVEPSARLVAYVFVCLVCAVVCPAAHAQSPGLATEEILDPVKQKAIWDAEHVTFEIEVRFGKPFLAALRKQDRDKLATWLHKDFAGKAIPSKSPVRTREKRVVREIVRSAASEDLTEVTGSELVAAILAMLEPVAKVERIGMRVLQIAAEGEGRWVTTVLLTASGTASNGSLIAVDSKQRVAFRIQDDAEFISGPCVSSWEVKRERQLVAPKKLMEEVTQSSGLTRVPVVDNWKLPPGKIRRQFPSQFAVEDFDRDGFLDLAIATIDGPTALYRSVGGTRFEVANLSHKVKTMSTRQMRSLATWIDFNNDAFPDLILGDRVYRNEGGERFVEVTAESGLTFPQRQMGAIVADYDGDGWNDLYVIYQFSRETGSLDGRVLPWVGDDISGARNTLWRNLGDGRFEDVTEKSGSSGGLRNSLAAAWLYANGDSYPDLYVANDFGKNNLLLNRGDGTFEDVSEASGVADFATSMGVAAGDIDNDGHSEVYVANMYSKMGRRIIAHVGEDDYGPGIFEQIKGACAGNRLYRRESKGTYTEWSERWGINDIGWAYAPAMADLDNDGLLDLYATTGFMSFTRGKPDG